ncbi:rhodanese-related sulfurtransferase [Lottiidibacillus patelloidae]|uniref:Rhodanese-related sulfurtransferase n=2 Tax=Lottiidibacillus patelloidae TaxID=2670334 RepID=A0A263BZM5_9BACI|nr:rhodanese-related sulfurtransferase [Lottiidibacillus patelloidae]
MGTLNWIQKWYVKQCNGDWEHSNGVRIDTIDNPGWKVQISVEDTDINENPFESIDIERTEDDWIYCKIEYEPELDGFQFVGYGGPENLEEILTVFKKWVE